MNDTVTQSSEQRQANLMALHRQLQEMAVRVKWSDHDRKERTESLQGPVHVIRGK